MRVQELIDSLKDCHSDAIVYVWGRMGYVEYRGPVTTDIGEENEVMKVYMITQGIQNDYPESLTDLDICSTREIAERELNSQVISQGFNGFITEWVVITE